MNFATHRTLATAPYLGQSSTIMRLMDTQICLLDSISGLIDIEISTEHV